ncbi:hypothetical protein [Acinetobacter entericus]|uniref:Uncharacterized protein n=1 Tax=Acinetobacter entericus TaxID=2989714 RepID=A0ABT3NED9_9GAMM|nr:hypothetical protein [Acinetobacter entericus]MCW8037929.1 hypothetical protein [Acinetobacter entericus]
MKPNDSVEVDFISESRTEFSGNRFTGMGVIDRCEDGYVYGRLDNGLPFMCNENDVSVMEHAPCFETWIKAQEDDFKILLNQHGKRVFIKRNGEYEILSVRLAHKVWRMNQNEGAITPQPIMLDISSEH